MKTPQPTTVQNKPQLSAEIEQQFDVEAQARQDERNKVIEEVKELIAYSSFEMTPGGRPMERTCSVEEAMRQLEKDVAKLNQLKEEEK